MSPQKETEGVYKICAQDVKSPSFESLEGEINQLMLDGWRPWGSAVVCVDRLVQIMRKKKSGKK